MKKFTALESIRRFCLQCEGGSAAQVAGPFYAYRMGEALSPGKHRPLKAIRTYCIEECQAGQAGQVEDCQGGNAVLGACPVFPFRMGRNPNISSDTRAKLSTIAQQRILAGNGGCISISQRAHAPFQLPESTKAAQPDLGIRGNSK